MGEILIVLDLVFLHTLSSSLYLDVRIATLSAVVNFVEFFIELE